MGGCFSFEDRRSNPNTTETIANVATAITRVDGGDVESTGTEAAAEAQPEGINASTLPRQNLPSISVDHETSPDGVANICVKPSKLNGSLLPTPTTSAATAGTSSSNISTAGTTESSKTVLKCEPIRWSSSTPLTESQLRQKRETFWDTAPTYEGRPEIWAALRAAAEAFEVEDFSLAQAVLQGADIQLASNGSLSECWDERGNYYHIPLYCLAAPTNLSSGGDNLSSMSPSASSDISLSAAAAAGENSRKSVTDPISSTTNNSKDLQTTADSNPVHNTSTTPDSTYDAANMLNVRLRFFYVAVPPATLQAEAAADANSTKRSNSRNSNHSTLTKSTKKLETTVATTAAAEHAPHATASPTPSVVPVKDMKFPISLLETVGTAKRRARDKFLSTLLLGGGDWRVQHWFFAGRLLHDKQQMEAVHLLKSNVVVQVIIRERDLKQLQQNHHHHHHKQSASKLQPRDAGPSNSAAAGSSNEKPSFFSRLSGGSNSSKSHAATVVGTSSSVASRPATPAVPLTPAAVIVARKDSTDRLHGKVSDAAASASFSSAGEGAEPDAAAASSSKSSRVNHDVINGTAGSNGNLPVGSRSAARSLVPNEGSGDI